ncbi:response regulator [Desulfococcaceae bacterium HSG8]|nr:response regulator [Desulfococcaceae bacterium HSG8]
MNNSDISPILIVDDNPFNRELLRGLLETEGFSVEEAQNGKEAIEYLEKLVFRMIFMDLLMPGMDGFETIRRIRLMKVKTPIVIVSSMDSKQDRRRCLEAGGDDFLPKPIDIEKIKTLTDKYEAESPLTAEDRKTSPEDERLPSLTSLKFSDYHVLLVEENDGLADRYHLFLKKLGFEVTHVSNGNKAWDLFMEHPHKFHIIISNIFTSGIDGLGILAKIKRDYLHVLVFIYAVTYDADTFQLAIQLGADGVITEAEFETSFIDLIESAIYRANQKGSHTQVASTASQVRKAQEQLIKYGCSEPCNTIDIAYSSLSDAGGDLACCRRFNLAGRCGIMLGDVAGHNVISSYISAISLGILTTTWDKNQNPLKLLKIINAELNKADYSEYHLCATALLWDRYREKIKMTTAGNPGGLLVKKMPDGAMNFRELDGGGLCLGLVKEDHLFLTDGIDLGENTYFFLFSDGITKEHIIEVLHSGSVDLKRESIRGMSQEILDGILEKHGQADDMILITLNSADMREKDKHISDGSDHTFFKHYGFMSSYEAADEACRWAADQCIPDKIPRGRDSCFIFLALREALINAVKHGNKFNPDAYVDMSLFFDSGELRIEVSDEGPGFELSDKIKKIEDVNVLQSGGRGLSVMRSVVDDLETSGGTVTLIFRRKDV